MINEQISIDSYKIFNTVARTGNITNAAKSLYISQPAVSKAITKLEQALSITLFTRSSRGVKLTDEGRLLYEYTSDAFQRLRDGENALHQINSLGIRHLRIGTSTTLCRYLLLPYLKEFISLYPHIHLTIQCQSTYHTLSMLADKKVDIGLIGKPDKLPADFEFIYLTDIEDIFAATPTYLNNLKYREKLIDKSDEYGYNEFEKLISTGTLMLLDEENITRQYLNQYMNKLNIKAEHILEVSSMDLLIEFAKIGLGIACVVQSFVEKELRSGQLIKLPMMHKLAKREAGLIYDMKKPMSEPVSRFIDFCNLS